MFQLKTIDIKSKNKLTLNMKVRVNIKCKIKPYLYIINFPSDEESLCNMEMKYLFNKIPKNKQFLSYHYVSPTRSPFIKQCISIIYTGNTLENIIHQIVDDNLCCEKFKVFYINYGHENVSYHERRKIEYLIGQSIKGEAELHNPNILFGITKVQDKWILGEYEDNNSAWKIHDRKPYYYSNGLGVRVARTIVNIAVSNNMKSTIIDPCCGVGTVLMEALFLGINIKGYEINPMIAKNAKRNLEYFGYENVVTNGDMNDINEKFDVSIIDLPYGLFSSTTLTQQLDIMKTARRISNKMVIVTFKDMDKYIVSSGFSIVDKCYVCKGKFKRYITICK